jgi:hypothetical protein
MLRRGLKSLLMRTGYTIARLDATPVNLQRDHHLFLEFGSQPFSGDRAVVLVGTGDGLHGMGKVSPSLYFPKFAYALSKLGVSVVAYHSPEETAKNLSRHPPERTAFVFIYNETFQRELLDSFAALESKLCSPVYNRSEIGRIVGDKFLSNEFLSAKGVPLPRLLTKASTKVFSNARIGSHAAIKVVNPGEELSRDRYNTEFIDTRYEYNGSSYFAAIRALAVTGTMTCAFVRLRPAKEDNPSVHASDTPKNASLIFHFHERLIEANESALLTLCSQLGNALGPGFYAHDILPCKETGKLYVCESGFKFDCQDYREAMWPISSDLPFLKEHFSVDIAEMQAAALFEQALANRQLASDATAFAS